MTLKEYAERLARALKTFDAVVARSPLQIQRSRDNIVREFLLASLMADFAREKKISVSDKEWDEEMSAVRLEYADDISFRKVLAEENISLAEWKDSVRQSVLKRKVFQTLGINIPKATDDELKKYFEEQKEKFKYKDRVLLRQIVVDDQGKAEDLLSELKKKRDFIELAKKFSVGPERRQGGLVGWIEKGTMEQFDKAFNLSVGALSAIIQSPFGFHIFRVEKKESSGYRKFEEVRPLVEQLLAAQREQKEYTQWLDQQIRSAKVSVNYELMNQLKIETRIQE